MKKGAFLLLFFLNLTIVYGESSVGREVENYAFGAGEILEFKLNYGPINAGMAQMRVEGPFIYQGKICYRLISEAWSNRVFSLFFRVKDRVVSILDKKGIYPLRFEKHLREGSYRADRFTDFDQEKHLAFNEEKDTIEVDPFVQDVLSALYWVRTQPIEVDNPLQVSSHTDGKNYLVEVRVLNRERIKVGAGVFDCLVIEPKLKEGTGIFKHKGQLLIWLTDDRRKMPVLMKSKVIIGSISAELIRFRPGRFFAPVEVENVRIQGDRPQ